MIQHKIELLAAGFEYNEAAGASLADSRKALLQHYSNLDSLCLAGEKKSGLLPEGDQDETTAGGVHAVTVFKESVRLFTLGSVSRGIPYEEWWIQPPYRESRIYAFYPGANVITFVGLAEVQSVHWSSEYA